VERKPSCDCKTQVRTHCNRSFGGHESFCPSFTLARKRVLYRALKRPIINHDAYSWQRIVRTRRGDGERMNQSCGSLTRRCAAALCPKRPFLTYRKQLLAHNLSVKRFLTQNVERRTLNSEVENSLPITWTLRQGHGFSNPWHGQECPCSFPNSLPITHTIEVVLIYIPVRSRGGGPTSRWRVRVDECPSPATFATQRASRNASSVCRLLLPLRDHRRHRQALQQMRQMVPQTAWQEPPKYNWNCCCRVGLKNGGQFTQNVHTKCALAYSRRSEYYPAECTRGGLPSRGRLDNCPV